MRSGLCTSIAVLVVTLYAAVSFADIYVVRRPDGTLHFSNAPGARSSGRLFMRGGPPRQGASGTQSQVITAEGEPDVNTSANVRSLYAATARDPARYTRYDTHIREAATLYQIPEALIRAVIRQESDFNPYSVSNSGAAGLMQLMPETARSMSVHDRFDPRQSILGGTRYLRILANGFNGDLVLTIAAYNAGGHAVIRYAGIPPYEQTQHYVRQVLRYYYMYRAGRLQEEQPQSPPETRERSAPAP